MKLLTFFSICTITLTAAASGKFRYRQQYKSVNPNLSMEKYLILN